MSPSGPPKALLFDIGGVCVLSPFQAILDYEVSNNIPPGWVNVAISGSKPNGSWHKLGRGELKLNKQFYELFRQDLRNEKLWKAHVTRARAKAEEHGQSLMTEANPPPPDVDTEYLIEAILRISRNPDPHMYPALKRLKSSNRFLMAALSNTMPLPDGHIANQPHKEGDVRAIFDPFVSSAHTGVRKPELRAYELAMEMMRRKWAERGNRDQLNPEDVVFIDDIGENLRQGRKFGFQTVKVVLGKTQDAIRELEVVTGVQLSGEAAKL